MLGPENDMEMFADRLNPATNHKVICAIDFGTSGTGYVFAFTKPNDQLDPRSDVFPNKPWPLTLSGKTDTAIVLKNGECVAFGKRASDFMARLRRNERQDYLYFHDFKMQLYKATSITEDMELEDMETGKKMKAVTVIGACLKEVKTAFMKQVSLIKQIQEKEVLWVVTVPAIWKDDAKKLMRNAARAGGLISSCESGSLMLALEPEAASIWCLSNQHVTLKPSSVYIVADCGGGTIDVTVHRVSATLESKVKEAFPVTGGDWGSTAIDRRFFELIKDIFGAEMLDKLLKDSKSHLQLREEWEKRKCSYDGEGETTISLPQILTVDCEADTLVDTYNFVKNASLEMDGYQLILPEDMMLELFSVAVEKTVKHLEHVVKSVPLAETIILVGNFANSVLLQKATQDKFRPLGLQILVPPNPGTCVVNGAVLLGNQPSYVSEHISRFSYGARTSRFFKDGFHDPEKLYYSSIDGSALVGDIADWFVKFGETIPFGKVIKRRCFPVHKMQTGMRASFYEGQKAGIMYTTDEACRELGEIVSENLIYEDINKHGVEYSILFGASEIVVRVKDPSGKIQEATIEYK